MRSMLTWGLSAAAMLACLTGCPPAADTLPDPIDVAKGLQAEYLAARAPFPYALAFTNDDRVFFTEKNSGQS